VIGLEAAPLFGSLNGDRIEAEIRVHLLIFAQL
jgi:hypothetical protein